MRAVIVYESMFGNTETVARAIGQGLEPFADVRVVEVGEVPAELDGVDLLVVGGPTHAFGMSRASTRQDAERQADGPVVSRRQGIREWLPALPPSAGVAAAAFDTRVAKVRRLPGSAARGAAKLLRRHRYAMVAPPESFYVDDVTGPLLQGELDRARVWGSTLAESFVANR
jgi:Flavodoxin